MVASRTVLVVDDDRDTRELYSLVFSMADWTVLSAGTARDAVRLASTHTPAMVLCDWLLPDGDGAELCRNLRRVRGMRKTPIVAVTGVMMTPGLRAEARRAGVSSILEKPVLPDRVREVADEALELCRARQLRAAAVRVCRVAAGLVRQGRSAADRQASTDAGAFVAEAAHQLRGNVAIMIANNGGQYVAANATAAALTGYALADLLSLSVWDLTPLPRTPESRELWSRFIEIGCQEGKYVLRQRNGGQIAAQYCAVANVAPGLHLSAMMSAGAGVEALAAV